MHTTVTSYVQNAIQIFLTRLAARVDEVTGTIRADFDLIDQRPGQIFCIRHERKKKGQFNRPREKCTIQSRMKCYTSH